MDLYATCGESIREEGGVKVAGWAIRKEAGARSIRYKAVNHSILYLMSGPITCFELSLHLQVL